MQYQGVLVNRTSLITMACRRTGEIMRMFVIFCFLATTVVGAHADQRYRVAQALPGQQNQFQQTIQTSCVNHCNVQSTICNNTCNTSGNPTTCLQICSSRLSLCMGYCPTR